MGSEWREMALSAAGVDLIDCVHKTPPAVDAGHPYVAIPQMSEGRINYRSARRISPEDFREWTRKACPCLHDVVLSRRCNPGETAYVTGDVEFALGQNLVLLRANGKHIYPPFLRWLTRSPAWWNQIRTFLNVGAVFDSLKCADVPRFRMPIPPLPSQRCIARVLGSLDDKIELNRRMNRTLEKMAAAIFKSWFIDFDPVRTKAECRDTGLPAEIANLFPDTLEDSNLGPIPKGWNLKPIGDAVRCVGGATPSTKDPEFWDGGTHPFVTPKDMSSLQSPVILDSERHITDAGVEKISSKQLPVGTVILSSRAPIGYLGVATVPVSVNQGVIAMICDGDLPNLYVLHWTAANMDLIKSRAGGTTFAEISKRNFRPIPALVPNVPVLEAYMTNVAPLHERITLNVRQSRRLAGLRDTLLPKLLSGEVELPAAEALAEEVT